ncbi:MAG: choloylglycine hydrolase [Clostridia bacterium]|nr:choloylglycine hydrolase [Clostridia bacterium]MBQ9795328.1 choloylglycine hydrolase [Clostridia bacterium]
MCTALDFHGKHHYFGRNLDWESTFGEEVTVTPRNFPLPYRAGETDFRHFAFLGMATLLEGYPLYFDGTNEYGLSVAGLNFVGNAVYRPLTAGKENLTPYELIPRLLGTCRTVSEARELLSRLSLLNLPVREDIPLAELHWLIADREESAVLEATAEGVLVWDDPMGVLTNNPPFPYHLEHINEYMNLSAGEAENRFAPGLSLRSVSRGMGALGLPGDISSSSRFIRASFAKWNSVIPREEIPSVGQFFHILDMVSQVEGCVRTGKGCERTQYSSCCNTDLGIYYYKTYENSQINAVQLFHEDLEGTELVHYPLRRTQAIYWENGKGEIG